MRRKSNLAPGDSEEKVDERCMGLHNNDYGRNGCALAYAKMCESAHVFGPLHVLLRYTVSQEYQSCNFTIVEGAFYKIAPSNCRVIAHMSPMGSFSQAALCTFWSCSMPSAVGAREPHQMT